MERSFGLFFFLKKNKWNQPGQEIDVYLKITVNGKSTEISSKRKCDPLKWNASAGRAIGQTDYAKAINSYLDVLQRKVYEFRKQLEDANYPVTVENIKHLLKGGEMAAKRYMLMQIFKQHNDQMRALVGQEYAPGTLERYETSYRHTQSFLLSKYKVKDLEISQLNHEFMAEYEFWLKSVRKCDHNSAMKYLANFKKIVLRCIKNGWLRQDPFINFKLTKREVERIALTENEVEKIAKEHFQMESTSNVRDIFLFCCYTGLAYADVEKLKKTDIVIGNDGEKWLISRRQKTDITARIPLLQPALNIIEKHANHSRCLQKNAVLPVLSNQKMNDYLKIIADQCLITKTLTFHIARHTFATTITLSNGVPIETVSKMLGHRNLKTTQHYAKILDKKIGDDMKGLKQKYG
jgi:site-specific recombinase XerD